METFAAALSSSWQVTLSCTALLGIVCHQIFRQPVEVDSWGWKMVITYFSVLGSVLVGYILSTELSLASAILRTYSAGAAFLVGLSVCGSFVESISVGSYLFSVYDTARTLQYHLHVQKLHSKYGDFVRTGPREVTVLRASAVELIYGSSSKCTKGTWYDQNSGNPDKVGIENVRDKEKHRVRRKAWDKGLGFRALKTYETRVSGKVNQLMTRIGTGKPVNITQDNIFYAFDVMGDIAFSKDFHMLR
ncbi:uncharacterized protein P174DRAFT_420526 [Aspergillus novofumigatus IBT 16806]|uniref:Uncharacterized protein n=1 Tax=Aspergillus novofumigatus (strain IBT 16806) TaxID=1392255 RepID=A0A2I1C8K2_ASPN1|nr:uncharacterized protein P174DRAFT_420526 [Aspergillus novofumigatus IBT 16806]PKX93957.1 hypothetical protein P174DRAFT_420526 [Aspergillus novofumigatus IBT 16806]